MRAVRLTRSGALIEGVLPCEVVAYEQRGETDIGSGFAEELEVVRDAVDRRRREFLGVRECARAALADLGYRPVPILPGRGRAPIWPRGVVGSMTHCEGYRAAALARTADVLSLGIDAEPDVALPEDVLSLVAGPDEVVPYGSAPGPEGPACWGRLAFCAKEAVFKAWYPLTSRWLGFEEVRVRLHKSGSFHARLPSGGPDLSMDGVPRQIWEGQWRRVDGILLASVVLRAGEPDREIACAP